MKIKSSFSFHPPTAPPSALPISFESTLIPKPAADILFSGTHQMGLVRDEKDLYITKEIRHGNREVIYNY